MINKKTMKCASALVAMGLITLLACDSPEDIVLSIFKDEPIIYDLTIDNGVEKNTVDPINETEGIEEKQPPTRDEVFDMREKALDGMVLADRVDFTDLIRYLNTEYERLYIYGDVYEWYGDPDSPYWILFHEKGEKVEISNPQDGRSFFMRNDYDADTIVALLTGYSEALVNEDFKEDIQTLINEFNFAAETHDIEHILTFYKILHDMDYYLLRYGIDDMKGYVRDLTTVKKYYGVLKIYKGD